MGGCEGKTLLNWFSSPVLCAPGTAWFCLPLVLDWSQIGPIHTGTAIQHKIAMQIPAGGVGWKNQLRVHWSHPIISL